MRLHKYLYDNASPVSNSDPTGYFSLAELWGTIMIQKQLMTIGFMGILAALFIQLNAIQISNTIHQTQLFLAELFTSTEIVTGTEIANEVQTETEFGTYATVEEGLGDIAGRYGNSKCKEAAEAMKRLLEKLGKTGSFVIINFVGGPGYIVSVTHSDKVVSENGIHMGVKYLGIVFCNIHIYGLLKPLWIADFEGVGIKTVTEIPFG